MTKLGLILLLCTFSTNGLTQDFHLRYRADSGQPEIVSMDDVKKLAAQGATLDGMKLRLDEIAMQNLEKIHTVLENDVMPTIYIMTFFKWLLSLIIAAIIGAAANSLFKYRHQAAG